MRRSLRLALLLSGFVLATPALAQEKTGHIDNWESWSLDWEVKENTGLALRNVTYQGEMVLAKASMPVIRVKYVKERHWWNPLTWFGSRAETGRCGPFQDRIRWKDLVPIKNCGDKMMCVESYEQGGVKWLELGVYARIGAYHIYQAWYLNSAGEIHPTVYSRGLSCNTDHIHHPYWRLDFDIDGNGMDQVFVHDEGAPNEGWGPGWHKYRNELNAVKDPEAKRTWFVRDQPTGRGVWIIPGPGYSTITPNPLQGDGHYDKFADKDVGVRRDRAEEDQPWAFAARGHLGYDDDNEGVQEQDIVFWYVGHLPHEAQHGELEWLGVGPVLRVQR